MRKRPFTVRPMSAIQPTRPKRGTKQGHRRPSMLARPNEGYVSETVALRPGHAYHIGALTITPDTLASVRILHPRADRLTVERLATGPTRRPIAGDGRPAVRVTRRPLSATPRATLPAATAPRGVRVPLAGQLELFAQ